MAETSLPSVCRFLFGMSLTGPGLNRLVSLPVAFALAQPPFDEPPKGGLTACQAEVAECEANLDDAQAFPATGQTSCWDSAGTPINCDNTGHDGDVKAGAALSYTDNGDGTITDNNTELMWDKKDSFDSGGTVICTDLAPPSCDNLHDVMNQYSWNNAFLVFIDRPNNRCNYDVTVDCKFGGDADCVTALGPGETCGFAGHRDSRLPNVKELQSIVNYETDNPAVSESFHSANCIQDNPSCTIANCSCTLGSFHWSSTSSNDDPTRAWG